MVDILFFNVCSSQNNEYISQKKVILKPLFHSQHFSSLLGHCPRNSPNSCLAKSQFSLFTQYFTFGVSISPCIRPASLSSFRCWDTVAFAMGSSSLISP